MGAVYVYLLEPSYSLLTFTYRNIRIFLSLFSCSRAVHSPNPSPSTEVIQQTEDKKHGWLLGFYDNTRDKDDTTVGVGHSRRYCNTGYDQSQGRRPSTLKCIGPISKGDIEPNHPSEINPNSDSRSRSDGRSRRFVQYRVDQSQGQRPRSLLFLQDKKHGETVALYTLRKAVCKGYVGQQCKLHADWLSPVDGADWSTAVFLFIVL